MAIMYTGIKGCCPSQTEGNNSISYATFLLWSNQFDQTPNLYIGNENILQNSISFSDVLDAIDGGSQNYKDLGRILTTKTKVELIDTSNSNNIYDYITFKRDNTAVGVLQYDPVNSVTEYTTNFKFNSDLKVMGGVIFNDTANIKGATTIENTVQIGTDSNVKSLTLFGTLSVSHAATFSDKITANVVKSTSYVEANYFNSTSDKRAKTNIHKANFSALDIINKLSIYNFTYKSNNVPSIGIIAQEAQDISIDNFDIVINKEATGENGDYMSITESKLIYILWKAIQEQQEEIANLKKQLEVK